MGLEKVFFFINLIQFFYGRGWGTVSDFLKKKKNSNLKIFFSGEWGEGCYSK